jgi:hypothetical protein
LSNFLDEQRAAKILEEALTAKARVSGGDVVTQAAGDKEMVGLLNIAEVLSAQLSPEPPTKAAVARTRARVLNRIGAARKAAPGGVRPKSRPGIFRRYAFALVSLFLVFAILASGTGVAYAAGGSLPGDGLYGVKLAYESARLALTFSPEARGAYLRGLADERLTEIQSLLHDGRTGDLPAAADNYGNTLGLLEQASEADQGPNFDQTRAMLQHHLQVLQSLLVSAPEPAQSGLENALTKSQHGLEVLDAKEQGISPSDLAPGQLKKTPSPDGSPGKGNGAPSGHTPGPPGGPPGQNRSPGDHTPGPPGGPPGQNNGGGSDGSPGHGKGN